MNFIHTHKVNSGEYIFGEFELKIGKNDSNSTKTLLTGLSKAQ